ncbi:hypothetical protein JCM1841_000350, partial [Sporobolomyces salmonicolor]
VEAWLASAMLPPPSPRPATLDSGTANALIATGVGSLCIQLRNGGTVTIKNTLLVEGLSTILISSSQLWDLHGITSHFAEHATLTRKGTVVTTGSRTKGSLYLLDSVVACPPAMQDVLSDKAECNICQAAHATHLPFPSSDSLASHPLELVHSDILCVDAASLTGKRYTVTFVDDFSRGLWVEPLDCKSDIFEVFKRFKAAAETESGRKLQRFRSGAGGKYSARAFHAYLDEHGVAFESPPPYSPASNGVPDHVNRSILEGIRAMLLQAGADRSLWAEALLAFVFVKNRSPHATLNSKVPVAVRRGRPVRVDMPRVWGYGAWQTLSRTNSKLDARAVPLVFVDYEGATRAYHLPHSESQRIVQSRDTRFQEDLFPLASGSPPATVDALPPNPLAALADNSRLSFSLLCSEGK